MEELVHQAVERTGLPEETVRQVVDVVLTILKEGLPAPDDDHIYLDQWLEEWGRVDRPPSQPASRKGRSSKETSMENFLRGLGGTQLN